MLIEERVRLEAHIAGALEPDAHFFLALDAQLTQWELELLDNTRRLAELIGEDPDEISMMCAVARGQVLARTAAGARPGGCASPAPTPAPSAEPQPRTCPE